MPRNAMPGMSLAEKHDDKRLFYEAVEEHHVVDTVLGQREAEPASEQFGDKAKVLKDLVEHHVEEEETEMFWRARKLMTPQRLAELKVLTKLAELVRP